MSAAQTIKKNTHTKKTNVVEGNSGLKDCFYIKVLTINLLVGHFFFFFLHKEKRKRKSLIH